MYTTFLYIILYVLVPLCSKIFLSFLRLAHLSPYHFAHFFKHSTGFSPHRYVIKRRVERAMLLLATTNRPNTFIAHEVGFASESHLATHFKRLTGLSSKHYRSSART
jgi:AraC family transcriptional regulator